MIDDGDLGEVGQADELGHQRDARPRRGRERAGPGPAGADGHADGRQLVLGLDDRERVRAVAVDAVLLEVLLELLGERRATG